MFPSLSLPILPMFSKHRQELYSSTHPKKTDKVNKEKHISDHLARLHGLTGNDFEVVLCSYVCVC